MKKLLILAAAVALFAACDEKSLSTTGLESQRIPLSLTTAHSMATTVATRSNDNAIQSTTLDPASTAVTGVFILKKDGKTNTSPESYEQWNLASNGYAANTTVSANTNISTSASLYYPDSKSQNLDIYAYVPRDASYSGTDISSTAATVTIKADQSTKANYLLSDVLWGCVGDGTNSGSETATGNNSNAAINATQYLASKSAATTGFVNPTGEIIIPMFHKAAKVIVKIGSTGMDISKLKGATVNFYVNGSNASTPTLSTSLNVYTGAITSLTPATPTHYIAPIKFTDKLGKTETGSDIAATASDANGTNGAIGDGSTITGYACSGIILPQTVTAGDKLIEIILSDAATKYAYVIPTTGTPVTNFQAGKVYTYTITITASGLVLTTTVADWDSQTADTGNAVLQ
ncbi:MAG: fimbrillin family protein [Bacteroidales bacterium]|nr:fimbrillin family protein [Bacteroidales bacterium]